MTAGPAALLACPPARSVAYARMGERTSIRDLDLLSTAILQVLSRAQGPLTANEVVARVRLTTVNGVEPLGASGYPPDYGDCYVRLQRLGGAGLVETRADTPWGGGHTCRLYWPAT